MKITHDFDNLVKVFENAPTKTKDMVRVQLKIATRDVQEQARANHRFITRSAALEQSVSTYVRGNKGTVFLDSDRAKHGIYIHEGTKAHEIVPRNKFALRWVSGSSFAFAKRVKVSGIEADPFLYNAADVCEPRIQARFADALDLLLNEVCK